MTEQKETAAPKKSVWRIVRHFVIPLLLVLSLFGGLIAGYVVVGKHGLEEVFNIGTWRHVFDLVFAP
ncbi:DNA-directed RNA polymerase subunit beta [Paenibacillus sp. P96]|uniref:DNA-directed RNA polymerase subunit beta n=1 Tax=Paenibacillus zeirhizosphaerae TaxID=2987519 RepID=A0ABT9FMW3_9BACL|nr:DNA-directed RNA polymerase subunit beta [Paenibacillus sp. P96]MDP4096079.1 DNA-directed RNA polymerase subunit beta [Paenibacillus sp. P96]